MGAETFSKRCSFRFVQSEKRDSPICLISGFAPLHSPLPPPSRDRPHLRATKHRTVSSTQRYFKSESLRVREERRGQCKRPLPLPPCRRRRRRFSHLHNNKVSCSFERTVSGGADGADGRGSMHLIRDPRSFTDQSQAGFRNHRAQQAALCLLHFLHLLHLLATSSRPSRFTQKYESQSKCDAQEASSMQLRCGGWVLRWTKTS